MDEKAPSKRQNSMMRNLLLTTAITLFLVIVLGGISRLDALGAGCTGWPTCNGQWFPALDSARMLVDYAHRVLTVVSGVMLVAALVGAWRQFRQQRLIVRPLLLAGALFLAQVLLGGVVAFSRQTPTFVAVHFTLTLGTLGSVLVATVVAFYTTAGRKLQFRSAFARLVLWATFGLLLVFVTGAFVSAADASGACAGWPLCGPDELLPTNALGWVQVVHRLAVAGTAVLMGMLFVSAWHSQRSQRLILTGATVSVILFFAQVMTGALQAAQGIDYMLVLHVATGAANWAAMAILLTGIGLAGRTTAEERREAAQPVDARQRARDLLTLTKPIIVVLLLVTTYAGMVVGGKALPSFWLTFWTMLGGALAAGGSGAVNMYIDRELDTRMQRTAKRPIAAGRMTPAEGLAFGVGLLLISFYLMAALVNLLAALLSLAGMIYYVLLYSIFLKKATVQNIVIGGGAGAIPPLVGWAAVTGSLNIPALFLFAIVFMWTPPHFWALAIIRSKDYKRAGIPMMPVVRGKQETRWQIFIYTLELVALTLLMPVFNIAGSIFLVSALVFGGALIYLAWKVWREGGNKIAYKMYRYSSMYLAFIFLAMMVDALIF
ncbi:MAG: protoheme IX farnesyltransferase [Anaerolineales bacterium]|nr:protoheme IX farnesyltransferase [Anaerolineales bacterium]